MAELRPCLHKSRETRQASAGRRSTTQAERIAHRAVRTSSKGTSTSGSRGAGYPQLAATEQDRGPLGWLQITMKPAHEDLADRITTRKDLATFLDALSAGGIEHGSHRENLHIFDMLEAMAAWLLRVVVDRALPSRRSTIVTFSCCSGYGTEPGSRLARRFDVLVPIGRAVAATGWCVQGAWAVLRPNGGARSLGCGSFSRCEGGAADGLRVVRRCGGRCRCA
jgi:hypothetical protein